MYKVFVGPERKLFYTHEAVLSQSPVFECMCHGLFKESMEREIELPDDDATVFGCMLECMYIGFFRGGEASSRDVKAGMLADLYILAEKNQLGDLKKLLIPELAAILDDASEAEYIECFFEAARKIYEFIPDSDVLFPDLFKQSVTRLLGDVDGNPWLVAQFKRLISGGGKLALDTFNAYFIIMSTNNAMAEERAATTQAQLQRQYRSLQVKHDALESRISVMSSKLSSVHDSHTVYHRKCKICNLLLY